MATKQRKHKEDPKLISKIHQKQAKIKEKVEELT